MRKTLKLLVIIGILSFATPCVAQEDNAFESGEELPIEFFQRWKLDCAMVNDIYITGLPQSPANDYIFKQNGEYIRYNEDETYITGVWEYHSIENIIYLKRDDGELYTKIVDIKAESMTFIPIGQAFKVSPPISVRILYIPKTE